MTTMIDLGPATQRMAEILTAIPDDALDRSTPCSAYTLGDLIEHVGGLTLAFTAAATKSDEYSRGGQSGDASRLPADWRTRIPTDLTALAAAWREPDAWTGMTRAGPFEMPGEVAGMVAANEVVVHGWDVARASGQPYDVVDTELLNACVSFVKTFPEEERGDAFEPAVPVADDAPLLDRVIGLNGRNPSWSPG